MKFHRLEKNTHPIKFWIGTIITGALIALAATIVIMLAMGYKFMIVSSGSMEPNLPVGSLIIVTPCEYEDLELGDIVTMNAGGINLTHRIVGKYDPNNPENVLLPGDEGYEEQYYWVTRGDASETLDGPLNDEIVGKVKPHHAFAWVGVCVRFLRANYVFVIASLVLLIVFVSIIGWMKEKLNPDDIEVYDSEENEK